MKQIRANQWNLVLAACGIVGLAAVAQADSGTNTPSATSGTNAPAATAVAPASQPYGKKANVGFLRRLNEAFMEQMGTPCYTPPDTNAPPSPTRRIGNPPFDSPPYPDGDWQIGGGPNVIGDPGALRDSPYPLMQAIYDGPNGKVVVRQPHPVLRLGNRKRKPQHLAQYWAQPGCPITRKSMMSVPDRVEIRPGRALYRTHGGSRTRPTTSTGAFAWPVSMAWTTVSWLRAAISTIITCLVDNKFTGFDTPMLYAQSLRSPGRRGHEHHPGAHHFGCPTSSNSLRPNNLMASHSLVYSFDDYTMWGLWTTTKLNANWCFNWDWPAASISRRGRPRIPGDQPTGSVMFSTSPRADRTRSMSG